MTMISLLLQLLILPTVDAPPGSQFDYSAADAYCGWQAGLRWREYVAANHIPDAIGRAQLRDAKWRCRCWDVLDNALRCHQGRPDDQAADWGELRALLGDDAFRRGLMPWPWPKE